MQMIRIFSRLGVTLLEIHVFIIFISQISNDMKNKVITVLKL